MDNRPIGFFDSGLGGLTCIPHLKETLPEERIIYFGDTARTPYGSKAVSTIKEFSNEIADFLVSKDVKMIVIACNTITSTCLDELRERHKEIPIIGIIDPAAKRIAEDCTPENRVGIIGTKVTIGNSTYCHSIRAYDNQSKLYEVACPIFVPLIEEGIVEDEIMHLSIKHYLDDFVYPNQLDTLVLGCTHYPLIKENIKAIYPHLKIVDPSEEIIGSIHDTLKAGQALAGKEGEKRENVFYASDLSENFINMIDTIFEKTTYKVKFKNFELEEK